jgi:CTP:molybdopterin cytidylyltransferase MocA
MSQIEDQSWAPAQNQIAAIILAAGHSSRMGAFKPLLPFGDKTVIETGINAMRAGGIGTIVVVIGTDQSAVELKTLLKNSDVSFAVNQDPDSEMSASIAAGVKVLPADLKAVIINPVDHAAVPASVVSALVRAWRNGAVMLKPVSGGRGGHPVVVDLKFKNELLNLDADRGLKALFDAHKSLVTRVSVESNYIARDMDTWDDYRALHKDVFGVPPLERLG